MWPLHFKHSQWWKRRSQSKFASHYAQGTNGVCECIDGCKLYMDSYMASKGSCFMVNRIILKNHLLEVGLEQHRETWHSKCLHMLICIILSCMRTHMNKNSMNWHLVEGSSHMASYCIWGFVTTLHAFGGVFGRPLDTLIWALTI